MADNGPTMVLLTPAARDATCNRCGTDRLPVTLIVPQLAPYTKVELCIGCLAVAIDVVTGWSIQSQMFQMVSVSDVVTRFRDPLRARQRRLSASAKKARRAP